MTNKANENEKIAFEIFKFLNNYSEEVAKEEWAGKHYQRRNKVDCIVLAQKIAKVSRIIPKTDSPEKWVTTYEEKGFINNKIYTNLKLKWRDEKSIENKKKKKCKFCNKYKKYLQHYYKSDEKYVEIKVSYCPVCGREL